jgi:hypothetical protein
LFVSYLSFRDIMLFITCLIALNELKN